MEKSVKKCPPYHLIASAVDGNEKAIENCYSFMTRTFQKPVCVPCLTVMEMFTLPLIWN